MTILSKVLIILKLIKVFSWNCFSVANKQLFGIRNNFHHEPFEESKYSGGGIFGGTGLS
jgi:hypothetical protein